MTASLLKPASILPTLNATVPGDQQAISELRDSYTRRLAAARLEPGDHFRNTAAHPSNAYISGR